MGDSRKPLSVDADCCVVDCLRWKKDLESASSEGGPRDAGILYNNLFVTSKAIAEFVQASSEGDM